MSRIGKNPVPIPEKVKVTVDGTTVAVEGPKGTLSKTFNPAVSISVEEGTVKVTPSQETRFANAMYGTARAIIANMVHGVTQGYVRDLEIHGVGFRAAVKGTVLDLSLGYSHPIQFPIPEGITVTVAENTKIKVEGTDKQVVGAVASSIRRFYPPEPYKGKGVRYAGERIRRKEGKTVA
ncbi:MAG: 50S ribosomal protein L6 [Puniceicoccaceae bacterium]|nr:MAG: 50S ribosomal protein L6 [Puniceicoccaceae bacterium]